MTRIFTHSGTTFDLLNPQPRMVRAEDIAVALSRLSRFNGHTVRPYSVAQHSVLVSQICTDRQAGLLHDAAEAYVGDMVRPLKKLLPTFSQIERRIQRAIESRFGLACGSLSSAAVKHADDTALATERRDLLVYSGGEDWPDLPEPLEQPIAAQLTGDAYQSFCDAFRECFGWMPKSFDTVIDAPGMRRALTKCRS